jgi:type IV secretory pathway TrbD component
MFQQMLKKTNKLFMQEIIYVIIFKGFFIVPPKFLIILLQKFLSGFGLNYWVAGTSSVGHSACSPLFGIVIVRKITFPFPGRTGVRN